jgi:hypothetical protein
MTFSLALASLSRFSDMSAAVAHKVSRIDEV